MIQLNDDKIKQRQLLSISDFLETVGFNQDEFYERLEGQGEEADWYADERNDEYQNAYSEAYNEAISELGDDSVDEAQQHAHEEATQWVEEREQNLIDYAETKVMYHLEDLLAAYRQASDLQ